MIRAILIRNQISNRIQLSVLGVLIILFAIQTIWSINSTEFPIVGDFPFQGELQNIHEQVKNIGSDAYIITPFLFYNLMKFEMDNPLILHHNDKFHDMRLNDISLQQTKSIIQDEEVFYFEIWKYQDNLCCSPYGCEPECEEYQAIKNKLELDFRQRIGNTLLYSVEGLKSD